MIFTKTHRDKKGMTFCINVNPSATFALQKWLSVPQEFRNRAAYYPFMPTVLYERNWRLFFYSNEGSEPIHIHAEKAGMECKYWLLPGEFEIQEAFSYDLTPAARREVQMVIYQNFDIIVKAWNSYFLNR